jgi:serine/threonine-protein kinase
MGWSFRRKKTDALAPGAIVAGKYRIERQLAAGGMGVIMLARHVTLDELVALKLLTPESAKSPDDVARFLREGRATNKLKSQHVVRVLDVGEAAPGAPYLAMELLDGQDLGRCLDARRPLAISFVVDCVVQACEAIAEAHALSIVHRDLKPANLFVVEPNGPEPMVKVLDFGISKSNHGTDRDLRLTSTQAVFGTPYYMAPEVLRAAKNADPRSDVWALGCILYELIGGRVPFPGQSLPEICAAIATDEPAPLASLRPEVPAALAAAVHSCLVKDPTRRVGSALELAEAIARFGSPRAAMTLARIDSVVADARARANARDTEASGPSAVVRVDDPRTLTGWNTGEMRGGLRGKWTAIAGGVAVGVAVAGGLSAWWVMRAEADGAPNRAHDARRSNGSDARAQPPSDDERDESKSAAGKASGARGSDGETATTPSAASATSNAAPSARGAGAASTSASASPRTKPLRDATTPKTPRGATPTTHGPSAVFDDPN